MIDKVLGIIGLIKELPEALGYSVYGPMAFSLPKEMRRVIGSSASEEIDTIRVVYLSVDNYTNREISDISVLYNGGFSCYTPNILFERRDTQPIFEHLIEEKCFSIKKLPPKESVHIELFLDESERLTLDTVMAEGRLITKWMQKIARMYRYPKLAMFSAISLCMVTLAAAVAVWTFYEVSPLNEDNRIIAEAMSDWDGCTPKKFENSIESEKLLQRKFQQQSNYSQIIFALNDVGSFDELKLKDVVILCEPKKFNR